MSHRSNTVPAPPRWKSPDARPPISYALKIVTPMFGGGYRAGQVDILNPIHAGGVRGNLRFWWRATSGAQYPTPQQLFAAEEDLWGSMNKPGKVATRIYFNSELQKKIKDYMVVCARFDADDRPTNFPLYALQAFAGGPTDGGGFVEPSQGLVNFPFELIVTCPDEAKEAVELAVSAWVHFGGIGARTRRGCGSLISESELPSINLEQIATAGESNERLTTLSHAQAYVGWPGKTAVDAWSKAVEVYRDFRQKETFARDSGSGGRPGRSRWPEPDTIKHKIDPRRSWYHPIAPHPVFGFPRADLGLPIIFQFKDEKKGDPQKTTLQGGNDGRRRFASPVITKAVSDGKGKFQSLLLILNAPHVWEFGNLSLTNAPDVTRPEIEVTKSGPPMNGQNVREALESYAVAEGMTRV